MKSINDTIERNGVNRRMSGVVVAIDRHITITEEGESERIEYTVRLDNGKMMIISE